MDRHEALHRFMESFGIPAYVESSVPPEAPFPYLTYAPVIGESMDDAVTMPVNVWYRTDSEAEPNRKVDEMAARITRGGICVGYDYGMLWLKRGTPWAQAIKDADPKVKRRYLNIDIERIDID